MPRSMQIKNYLSDSTAIFSTPETSKANKTLKGEQRPAAFAIVCFCFCEFRTVSYLGRCGEQAADVVQSMLVFVFPLKISWEQHSRQIFSFVRSSQGALTHIAFSARIDQSDAVISLLPRFAARFRPFWVPPNKKHCTLE